MKSSLFYIKVDVNLALLDLMLVTPRTSCKRKCQVVTKLTVGIVAVCTQPRGCTSDYLSLMVCQDSRRFCYHIYAWLLRFSRFFACVLSHCNCLFVFFSSPDF